MTGKKEHEDITSAFPQLNLPPCRFRMKRREDGTPAVWDPLRRRWLVLTPEEWVRRHLLGFFTDGLGIPPGLVSQEHPVPLAGGSQRADIVVHRRDGSPLLVAECKAPYAGAGRPALEQAVRYNSVLHARYVMVTDGMKHHIVEMTGQGEYLTLPGFPELIF